MRRALTFLGTLLAVGQGASSALASADSFDCARAPELLGRPGSKIVVCRPFYGSPRLWFLWVEGAPQRLALIGEGPPYIDVGLRAAGRYLIESGLNHNKKLDGSGIAWFLKAADGYPPGFRGLGGVDIPGIGRTTFSANPVVYTVFRQIQRSSGHRGGGPTPPGGELYERAVLKRNPGGWFEWVLSLRTASTSWKENDRVPLK